MEDVFSIMFCKKSWEDDETFGFESELGLFFEIDKNDLKDICLWFIDWLGDEEGE